MEEINYGKQTIEDDDISEVVKVLKSNHLTSGPLIAEFENSISNKFDTKYCSVVSNGTAALHMAGIVLNWGEKDIVITTALTFVASINSILYCGATPDIVDIDLKTNCIDIDKLESKIKNYFNIGKKVKAVIAVDFAGHPCQWEDLYVLSKKYDFNLVNDNCHAIGAKYKGDIGYAAKYASLVTHSYHPVKNITTGEGGSVLTNNKNYHDKIQLLRSHSINRSITNQINKHWFYEIDSLGYNYRLTDIQCALGINQLKKLNFFINIRNKIANKYLKSFDDDKKFILPIVSSRISHAFHLFILRINFNLCKLDKESFFIKMKERGINLQVHYIPLHKHKHIYEKYKFDETKLENVNLYYQQAVSLPIYPTLTDEQQDYVIKKIKELL